MQDLTTHTPHASRRSQLRAVTAAVALSLVAVGCSADASSEEPAEEDVAAAVEDDATDDASTQDDTTTEEAGDDGTEPSLQRLEDVAGGGELVPLDAGPYTGDLLDGLVVSVPEGTDVFFDADDQFVNYIFEGEGGTVFVLPITGVVPPDRVGAPVTKDELASVLAPVPDDMGTYFGEIPQLEVLDSGATDTYRWWDVKVRPDLGDTHTECGGPPAACISLWGEPSGEVTLNVFADWSPRVIQPIDTPSVLLWAAGTSGIIGGDAELATALAEGLE